jgi:hypothetical protein
MRNAYISFKKTPRNGVNFEKLIVAQLLEKFYETKRFIMKLFRGSRIDPSLSHINPIHIHTFTPTTCLCGIVPN